MVVSSVNRRRRRVMNDCLPTTSVAVSLPYQIRLDGYPIPCQRKAFRLNFIMDEMFDTQTRCMVLGCSWIGTLYPLPHVNGVRNSRTLVSTSGRSFCRPTARQCPGPGCRASSRVKAPNSATLTLSLLSQLEKVELATGRCKSITWTSGVWRPWPQRIVRSSSKYL